MLWSSDVLTRTVTGNHISANGNPAQGKIYFRPTSRILDQDDAIILNTASISAVLDVNGAFSLELPVTDNPLLKPKDWAYEVIVRIYGTKETKLFLQLPYGDGSPVKWHWHSQRSIPGVPCDCGGGVRFLVRSCSLSSLSYLNFVIGFCGH